MSPVSLLEMMPAEAEDGAEGLLSLPSLEELLARTGGERRLSADIVRDLREQGITDEWIYNQEMSLRQPVEDWASVKASPEWAAMTRDEREERALAQVGHVFWHLPASYRAQPGFQAEWERAYEHFYENEILPIITTPGWGGFKEHLLNSYESTRANHAMLSLDAKVMRRSSLEADLAKWRALPEDLLVTFSDQPGGARGARQVRQVPVKLAREITQNRINYLDQDLPRLIEELQERKERIEQRHGWKGAQLFRDAEDLGDFWAKASGKDWAEAMGGLFLESGFSLGVTMLSAGVGMTVGGVASENPAGAAIGGAIGSSAAAYVVEYPARLYQEVAEHLHKRYPGWDQDGPVTLDEPIMVDGELVSTRVYTAEDRAELLLGVLGDEGVMKELRTRAARGAGAVAVTEGFTSALSFKISSDIFRNFQRGSAWKSTPLQAKTRAGLASLMATQPVGAAGGSAGEFLAYLFEGKDPTTGQAQKEIFAEGAIELFGAPIEVAGSATSLSLEGGAQWVQRRQQIKEHAQKAAQAMDAWDADALRAAQVPEERIAELEGTSNPVKRMELAQQYLQEADDVALEGIEYERLEDGGTRVRYPDGQEATYPDAQSMVDGHIQWREGREVLQRRLLSQEAASKDAVVEAAQHQLKLLEMDELEERSIDLPEKSVAGVIRAVRAVVATRTFWKQAWPNWKPCRIQCQSSGKLRQASNNGLQIKLPGIGRKPRTAGHTEIGRS